MKKIFTFFVAALAAVTLSAEPVQQEIPLDLASWGWGYNSTATLVDNGVQVEINANWGAFSTGWDPEIDLTDWDKIIIVVESMVGCDGEWFKLKAYLRDKTESEPNQLEGLLGNDAQDDEQNYLVIELQEKENFDLTHARILAIQCQPAGAKFVISRVYLEKEDSGQGVENVSLQNNGIRYNILGQEVDEDYKGIVILNGKKMIVR